ncbi:MAG: CHAT domain-containing protein [Acidobacteriota bacterium]
MATGWALRLRVDQQDLDIVLRVGDARESFTVDIPIGRQAPEYLCFVAGANGPQPIDITPFAKGGTYSLVVEAIHPATPADRSCAEALKLFHQAQETEANGGERAKLFSDAAWHFERAGEPFLAAVAWREVGSLRLELGLPQKAIEGHERALVLAQRARSAFLEISVLNRLGLACRDLGDLERASFTFERARARARETGSRHGLASALTNLGRLAPDIGDPHAALDHLREALEIWRSLGEVEAQAQTLINQATALGTLDLHEESLNALSEALELATEAGDSYLQASALTGIAWLHYLRGAPESGIERIRQALETYRQLGSRNAEAGVLDRLGTLLAANGEEEAAIEAFQAALRILDEQTNPRDTAAVAANLGCLMVQETPEEAEYWLNLAAAYHAKTEGGDPKSAANIAFCQARLAHHRGDLDFAISRVDEALDQVDNLRRRARAVGHRYTPIWLWQDYADLAIDLRLERDAAASAQADLVAAFEILDQARAWSLFEQVVRRAAQAPIAEPESLEARVREKQSRISLLAETRRRLRAQSSTEGRLEEIEATIRSQARELEDLRAERRTSERGAGRLGSPRAVSLVQLQALLPDHSAFLAYRLGDHRSDLFVVTPQSVIAHPLASREILESHAERFYRAVESSRLSQTQWRLLAESLSRYLLPESAIPASVERLFIMADGLLHYVPFGLLASPRRGYEIGSETHLLLDDVALSFVASASVFVALDERRRDHSALTRGLAVFADPVYALDDSRLATGDSVPVQHTTLRGLSPCRLPDSPLPRLPHSATEAAAVLEMVEGQAWVGFSAAKKDVLTADLSGRRYVHFATHAFVDEALPELSGLALARYNADGMPLDGDLYLHEIQELDLSAELVVLSGCQTALGKHVRGNGLLGLTHGFFDAGAARLLVSLWSVDDKAASLLLPVFYQELLTGADSAEALRRAQSWLRNQAAFEDPFYWGPFVVHGAP